MKAIHLKITGHVQGVFFRATTKEVADDLNLTGWVKNCDDGTVEVFAQGDETKLKEFEEWCEEGSEAAEVHDVQCAEKEPEHYDQFDISN